MRLKYKIGLMACVACATVPAYAAEGLKDDGLGDDPNTIIILATKIAEKASAATQPVVVVESDEIEASGQTDLTEVLRMQPSFEFKQAGGPGQFSYPRLRGFSESILYVVDGVKINEGRSGGVNSLVGQLDPSAIGRMEILRGPQATLYGADSTAGVISISTKAGGPTEGVLRAEAGSLDWKKGTGSIRTETGLGDGTLGLALNGTVIDSGGVREYEFYDNRTASGRLNYTASRVELGASLLYVDASFGAAELDEAYCCQTDATYWSFQTPDPNARNDTEVLLGSAWIGHDITDNLRHKLLFGYFSREYNTIDPNDGLLGYQPAPLDNFSFGGATYSKGSPVPVYDSSSVDNYSTSENYQLTYDLVYSHKDFDVLLGAEYWEQSYKSHGTYGLSNDRQDVFSVYGQVRIPLLDERMHVEGGIRHDEYNAWGGQTTYSAGAAYEFVPNVTLYANYGTSFTQPTLSQLFNLTYGDPSLTPATGETIEGGIRASALDGKLSGSVTVYKTNVDNVIAYDYSIPNPRVSSGFGQYINRDGKRTHGVELDVTYEPVKDLRIRGVYSYTNAEQTDAAGNWTRVVQTAYHTANIGISYSTDRFDLGATVYYTGDRLRWAADVKTPDYIRVDVSARYFVSKHFAVYTRVENLLDANIIEEVGYKQPGLYAVAGVQLGF